MRILSTKKVPVLDFHEIVNLLRENLPENELRNSLLRLLYHRLAHTEKNHSVDIFGRPLWAYPIGILAVLDSIGELEAVNDVSAVLMQFDLQSVANDVLDLAASVYHSGQTQMTNLAQTHELAMLGFRDFVYDYHLLYKLEQIPDFQVNEFATRFKYLMERIKFILAIYSATSVAKKTFLLSKEQMINSSTLNPSVKSSFESFIEEDSTDHETLLRRFHGGDDSLNIVVHALVCLSEKPFLKIGSGVYMFAHQFLDEFLFHMNFRDCYDIKKQCSILKDSVAKCVEQIVFQTLDNSHLGPFPEVKIRIGGIERKSPDAYYCASKRTTVWFEAKSRIPKFDAMYREPNEKELKTAIKELSQSLTYFEALINAGKETLCESGVQQKKLLCASSLAHIIVVYPFNSHVTYLPSVWKALYEDHEYCRLVKVLQNKGIVAQISAISLSDLQLWAGLFQWKWRKKSEDRRQAKKVPRLLRSLELSSLLRNYAQCNPLDQMPIHLGNNGTIHAKNTFAFSIMNSFRAGGFSSEYRELSAKQVFDVSMSDYWKAALTQ